MRDPVRSRNIAVAVVLLASLAGAAAIMLPDGGGSRTLRAVLAIGALMAGLPALVLTVMRTDEARRFARLKRGEGVLARWSVDPARWRSFEEWSRGVDRDGTSVPNVLSLRDVSTTSPTSGVDIVITPDAVRVGGAFHPVEPDVVIVLQGSWMAFEQTYLNPEGPPRRSSLRIPVPPGAEGEALHVQRHYSARYAAAARNPRFKIIFMVVVLLIVVVGIVLAMRTL